RNAAEQSVANGARLLEDFLLHEVLVAALFRHDGIPGDVVWLALDRLAVVIHDTDAGLREGGDVSVIEEKDVARGFEQRRNVAGDEEFVFAKSDDSWWSHARGHDFVRVARGHEDKRVDAAQLI